MNKYVFPGADASCSLGWVINQVESAGFEVKSIDVLGVHYSATIYRWYQNWVSNKEKVLEAYGERYVMRRAEWMLDVELTLLQLVSYLGVLPCVEHYHLQVSSYAFHFMRTPTETFVSRQGSASVFQFTLHKNLNAYHRINGVKTHASIHAKPHVEITLVDFF